MWDPYSPLRQRSSSQTSAPGARTRGMVQNAAITGALKRPQKSPHGTPGDGQALGSSPYASRPETVVDTPPAPLGAPTPGQAPVSSTMPVSRPAPLVPAIPAQRPPVASAGGNSQSDFLTLARRYTPNPSGLNSLIVDPDFLARFPNARIHKNDWVDLGDGSGLIDTVRGFNTETDGGEDWQWLTEADAIRGKLNEQAAQRPAYQPPSWTSQLLGRMLGNVFGGPGAPKPLQAVENSYEERNQNRRY